MEHPAPELRPTALRGKLAIIGLSVCAVQCLLSAGLSAKVLTLVGDLRVATASSPVLGQLAALEELEVPLTAAWAICFLTTAVLFCRWLHSAYHNVIVLQPQAGRDTVGLTFTPGGAVAGFFIPFVNLWRPYRAVRELWDHSAMNESTDHASSAVGLWWTAWLAAQFTGRAGERMLRPDASEDLLVPGLMAITISQLVWIVAAGLAIKVIRGVDERQELWIAGLKTVVPGRVAP